ncbi:MAG TPA: murein L,D-transpeptidase catalytic domain family protein, partial [Terriglobales bacterium]|nr:murein L,D-transpeptidase catalytic domain family protein [Terriglobales bacterium]
LLTVIDYSLPSTERRLWVIDLARKEIVFHELVAHGINSGASLPTAFSDRPDSRMSSLGLFRTGETYVGKHGLSLRLDGLEPGFNERARERAIVMHGAPYVSPQAIAKLDFLGRSWGCPAVSVAVHRRMIERIQGGSALFIYYPDPRWLSDSEYLNCDDTGTRVAAR